MALPTRSLNPSFQIENRASIQSFRAHSENSRSVRATVRQRLIGCFRTGASSQCSAHAAPNSAPYCIPEEAGANCAEWRPSNSCSVALCGAVISSAKLAMDSECREVQCHVSAGAAGRRARPTKRRPRSRCPRTRQRAWPAGRELLDRAFGKPPQALVGDPNEPCACPVAILGRMIDSPPEETREQWLARRHRELGIAAAPSTLMVPAAGASDPHFAPMRIWTGAGSRLEGGGAPGRRCGFGGRAGRAQSWDIAKAARLTVVENGKTSCGLSAIEKHHARPTQQ